MRGSGGKGWTEDEQEGRQGKEGRQEGRGFWGPELQKERLEEGSLLARGVLGARTWPGREELAQETLAAGCRGGVLAVRPIPPHFSDPQFTHL